MRPYLFALFSVAALLPSARGQLSPPTPTGGAKSGLSEIKSSLAPTSPAQTQTGVNLIPNWDFSDPMPLKGYRYDFPYQDWYVDNVKYIKQVKEDGKNCALIDLPPGIAGNQGGKVETALVPAEPGATYRVEVECMTGDFQGKLHCECFAVDPRPNAQRVEQESKGTKITISRIPPMDGRPALVQIYRAQLPDPPPHGRTWSKVQREFTLPMEWKAAGSTVKPAYMSIKATVYDTTMGPGKSYFTDFKLTKLKSGKGEGAPKTSGPASNKEAIIR